MNMAGTASAVSVTKECFGKNKLVGGMQEMISSGVRHIFPQVSLRLIQDRM